MFSLGGQSSLEAKLLTSAVGPRYHGFKHLDAAWSYNALALLSPLNF